MAQFPVHHVKQNNSNHTPETALKNVQPMAGYLQKSMDPCSCWGGSISFEVGCSFKIGPSGSRGGAISIGRRSSVSRRNSLYLQISAQAIEISPWKLRLIPIIWCFWTSYVKWPTLDSSLELQLLHKIMQYRNFWPPIMNWEAAAVLKKLLILQLATTRTASL